jgi:hypothetical protein
MQKHINPQTNPLIEETKILQEISYYNSIITNLKFQTQAKISCFKNPHIKINRPIIILFFYYLGGPKSLKLLYTL